MNNQTEQVTNPIQHARTFKGITINTNDHKERLQDTLEEVSIKLTEEQREYCHVD